jgi:hypothetical protein
MEFRMGFQVLGARRAPAGMNNCAGVVTFGYERTKFDPPLTMTRYVKAKKEGEPGKEFPLLDSVDGHIFKFHNVPIQRHNGKCFLSLNANLPQEVAQGVVSAALKIIDEAGPETNTGQSEDEIPF